MSGCMSGRGRQRRSSCGDPVTMNDSAPDRLLDVLDELCQLPAEQRPDRLDDLALTAAERREVERWLRYDSEDPQFLHSSPALVGDLMRLLDDGGASDRRFPDTVAPSEAASRMIDVIAPQPRIIGYEIKDLLGEGGMGTVWRARQLSTGRDVALKVMRPLGFTSMRARVRFDREVQLTARLEHPNV